MHAHASCREPEIGVAASPEREELLDTVASLRREVCSMASDIRHVLEENAALKDQLDRIKGRRSGERWLSEAQRIKREVDQLVSLHEATSASRGSASPMTRREIPGSNGRDADQSAAWLKKMMVFMMLAEMV